MGRSQAAGEEHMNPQPKALVLADALEELDVQFSHTGLCGEAADELRRLHEENERLKAPREWVGLNHFDRTLLRTTHAPLKQIYHDKNNSVCVEVVSDWDVFFDAVEAKLKGKNHG
jgi:hypothetical protein